MHAIHCAAHLHAPKREEIMKATQVDTHHACLQFIVLLTCMHQNVNIGQALRGVSGQGVLQLQEITVKKSGNRLAMRPPLFSRYVADKCWCGDIRTARRENIWTPQNTRQDNLTIAGSEGQRLLNPIRCLLLQLLLLEVILVSRVEHDGMQTDATVLTGDDGYAASTGPRICVFVVSAEWAIFGDYAIAFHNRCVQHLL